MKLFSRTSLVALGTAAAITVSGVTAPAFAQEETTTETTAPAVTIEETTEVETPVTSEAATVVATNDLTLKQPSLISGTVNSEITPVVVEVAAGTATKFSAPSLPDGLFIDNEGTIYGKPLNKFSGPVTITATGPNDGKDTVDVNILIEEEPSSGSSDTDEISNWIKIITAVIGALTTILTFGTKLDSFLK